MGQHGLSVCLVLLALWLGPVRAKYHKSATAACPGPQIDQCQPPATYASIEGLTYFDCPRGNYTCKTWRFTEAPEAVAPYVVSLHCDSGGSSVSQACALKPDTPPPSSLARDISTRNCTITIEATLVTQETSIPADASFKMLNADGKPIGPASGLLKHAMTLKPRRGHPGQSLAFFKVSLDATAASINPQTGFSTSLEIFWKDNSTDSAACKYIASAAYPHALGQKVSPPFVAMCVSNDNGTYDPIPPGTPLPPIKVHHIPSAVCPAAPPPVCATGKVEVFRMPGNNNCHYLQGDFTAVDVRVRGTNLTLVASGPTNWVSLDDYPFAVYAVTLIVVQPQGVLTRTPLLEAVAITNGSLTITTCSQDRRFTGVPAWELVTEEIHIPSDVVDDGNFFVVELAVYPDGITSQAQAVVWVAQENASNRLATTCPNSDSFAARCIMSAPDGKLQFDSAPRAAADATSGSSGTGLDTGCSTPCLVKHPVRCLGGF